VFPNSRPGLKQLIQFVRKSSQKKLIYKRVFKEILQFFAKKLRNSLQSENISLIRNDKL